MNNVVIVGRLTKDPELRYLTSGTAVATFTMAIDRDYKNKDGSITTDFIPVEIMGKPAEFVANYITKGRLVGVQGSIRVDRYETPDGEKELSQRLLVVTFKHWKVKIRQQRTRSHQNHRQSLLQLMMMTFHFRRTYEN